MACFWTALAEMLVSPTDGATLPDLWRYPFRSVARAWESCRSNRPQSAPVLLLHRSAGTRSLLRLRPVLPASQAATSRSASQGQTSFVCPGIDCNRGKLDLPRCKPLSRGRDRQKKSGSPCSAPRKKEKGPPRRFDPLLPMPDSGDCSPCSNVRE